MAKYADYVKKDDELNQEIDEAAQQTQDRQESGESGFELPERFKGKSAEEIARSYVELDKAFSRQGNDLGKMRQAMDEFLALQSPPQATQSQQEDPKPVSIDDLYENTEEAILRAVERSPASNRVKELEAELAKEKLNTRVQALDGKYEGWRELVKTPEFQNWVMDSPYRQRLAQAADSWDLDAADDLLGMYNDLTGVNSPERTARRERALDDATLETGAASVPASEPTFSRTELTQYRVRAHQGDPEAVAYLQKNREAIAIAYETGNITD